MSFDAKLGAAEVEIRAPLQQLERDLAKAKKTVSARMKNIGAGMSSAGRKMAMGLTLPIVALGAGIIKTAASFDQGMRRVGALTGATGDQFEKLKNQAKELGSTTQFTAREASDAMGFLAMAGFEVNEIIGSMPGTLQLAAAAQLDLASSADIVSNVLTGYQMQVSDLARVNDVLVKTFTSSNVNLSMLGQAMKVAGPVASAIGLEFEEVSAAIGLFGNAGIQGAQAGTHLRNVVARLAKMTPEAEKALKRLGIDKKKLVDSRGNVKSLTAVVRELGPHANRTKELVDIFGVRTGPFLAALLGQGADALEDFTQELREAGGTTERIAEQQMAGPAGAMLRLKSAVEGAALAIAESGLIDWFTQVIEKLTNFFSNLSKTNPEILKTGTIIAGLVAVIGPLLMAFGAIASGIGALISAFGFIGSAVTAAAGILAGITVGPIAALMAAIGALVAIFWFFRDEIKLIAKFVYEDIKEYLQTKLKGVVDFIKDQTTLIIGFWKDVFFEVDKAAEESGIKSKIQTYVTEPVKTSVRETAGFMDTAMTEAMDAIKLGLTTLKEKFGLELPDISGLFDDLGASAKKAGEEIETTAGKVTAPAKYEPPSLKGIVTGEEELKFLEKLEDKHLRVHDKQIELINRRRNKQLAALEEMQWAEDDLAQAKVLINETADKEIAKIQERQMERLVDFREEFKGAFKDSLADFFYDLQKGEFAFRKFADGIVDSIRRIAAERMAAQLTNAIFGTGGSEDAGVDWLGVGLKLAGAIGGGISAASIGSSAASAAALSAPGPVIDIGGTTGISMVTPPPLQHGGPVMPGDAYWVGESGRELFVSDRAGTMVPNAALRQSEIGGGRPINLTQNIMTPDANSFRASQSQVAADTAAMLRRADRRGN
jgi:TP901 family phage tail tape measure protein